MLCQSAIKVVSGVLYFMDGKQAFGIVGFVTGYGEEAIGTGGGIADGKADALLIKAGDQGSGIVDGVRKTEADPATALRVPLMRPSGPLRMVFCRVGCFAFHY